MSRLAAGKQPFSQFPHAGLLMAAFVLAIATTSACSNDPPVQPSSEPSEAAAASPNQQVTAAALPSQQVTAAAATAPEPTSTPTATETFEGIISIWPWFNDGLNDDEARLVDGLRGLYWYSAVLTGPLLTMPFLETVEPADIAAVRGLLDLVRHGGGIPRFTQLMGNPYVSDGISDREAKVVATLGSVGAFGPWLLPALLDPEVVMIEERRVDLPLAGEVELAIIRTEPGAARTMDILEHSVRTVERLLQVPLPARYVGVLFGDVVEQGAPAQNFTTHIGMLARYDVDQDHYTADYSAILLAHEVAHFYWIDNSFWLDEGLANLTGVIAEHARSGRPLEPVARLCREARDIRTLSRRPSHEYAFECHYSLSERFFLDLYRNLDEQVFLAALRNLYRLSQQDDPGDDCPGAKLTICHVRVAFTDDVPAESMAVAEKIIARWYDGTEPYDPTTFTEPPDPRLVTVNGELEQAFLSKTPDGGDDGTVFSLSKLEEELWLHIEIRYDPRTGGREVPFELVYYYEDGFAFGRQAVSYEFYYRDDSDQDLFTVQFWVGSRPDELAIGRYAVHLYDGDKKLLELEYEITP